MKVILPENQNEITLGQFQEYAKLSERTDLNDFELNKRKVKIFTGLKYRDVELLKDDDLNELLSTIDTSLVKECKFKDRFFIKDVEFGFIPNFDDIQAKEWFDLSTYDTKVETLHNLIAILFRPIISEVKHNGYEIENYKGTKKFAEIMKRTPLSIVNGALSFFLNLAQELQVHTLKFTAQEIAKEGKLKSTLKNGDGMRQLTELLKENLGNMHTLKI